MQRLRIPFGMGLIVWTLCWIAPSLVQGAGPADAVPSTACVVVRLKALDATLEKLADFVDEVQPGVGAIVRGGKEQLGQGFGNPGLKGIDATQDIYVIVFAEPQVPPTVVFVMTAKDVEDVKDALESEYEFHHVGNLVAYSADEDALDAVRSRMDGEGKPIWSKIDAATKKLFDASDASVLVNIKQLAEDFSDELDQAEPRLNAALDQLEQILPPEQQQTIGPALDIYRKLGAALISGVRDSESLAMGLSVSSTEIRYDDRLQVTDGTAFAKFLAGQPGGDLAILNRLPAGKSVYSGLKLDLSPLIEWSIGLTKGMMKDASEDQLKRIETAMKKMVGVKFDEISMYFDLSGNTSILRAGSVSVMPPAAVNQLRDASREMMKGMSDLKIKTPAFTQTTKLEIAAEKLGNADVDKLTTRQEFSEDADPTGAQKAIMEVMFGPEGFQQRVLYQQNRVVQSMGGGKETLQDLVKALDQTPAKDSPVAAVRKRFDEKTNVLVLADISRLMIGVLKVVANQNPSLPIDADGLAELKLDPAYLGYSLTFEPNAAKSRVLVPVTAIQNIMQVIPLTR